MLFTFLPADIVSQTLNFGLPAPIDIQVIGRNLEANRAFAASLLSRLAAVPGLTDLRVHQAFNQPQLHLAADRTMVAQAGLTQREVASNLLICAERQRPDHANLLAEPRDGRELFRRDADAAVPDRVAPGPRHHPVTGASGGRPQLMEGLTSLRRGAGMAVVSHYNVQPVIDIFGAVQGRDLGAVSRDITPILDASRASLPRGSQLMVRGQIETMRSSFTGLLTGLAFAIILVYLLIVVNFQSWLDPFIIVSALPAALAGIIWMLFASGTTISVPALTGAIMCVGVATANSILIVSFAKDEVARGRRAARRGPRRGLHAVPPRADDRAGDDHRHDPDGARARRRRRAERAARPCRHRRACARNRGHAAVRARGVRAAASAGRAGGRPPGARRARRPRRRRTGGRVMDAGNRRPARGVPLMGAAAVVLIIVVFGAIAWWGIASRARATTALERDTAEMSLPSVSVVSPKPGAPQEEIVLPATMQAFAEAPIYARTSGYLSKRFVELGTRVRANQVLAEIDAPELEQQLQQARADLTTADANARLAQVTADRYRELVKTDSVPQQDADNAAGTLEARKAAVESARHNVQRLEQLQAFTRITAPIDGVITARNTDVGALIDPGASGGSARELFHVASTDRLRVFVNVPQLYSRAARPGLSADITLAEFPGRRFTGRLVRTAQSIDPASRTLLTEIEVANPRGELLPGAYAQVHLKLETPASTLRAAGERADVPGRRREGGRCRRREPHQNGHA